MSLNDLFKSYSCFSTDRSFWNFFPFKPHIEEVKRFLQIATNTLCIAEILKLLSNKFSKKLQNWRLDLVPSGIPAFERTPRLIVSSARKPAWESAKLDSTWRSFNFLPKSQQDMFIWVYVKCNWEPCDLIMKIDEKNNR